MAARRGGRGGDGTEGCGAGEEWGAGSTGRPELKAVMGHGPRDCGPNLSWRTTFLWPAKSEPQTPGLENSVPDTRGLPVPSIHMSPPRPPQKLLEPSMTDCHRPDHQPSHLGTDPQHPCSHLPLAHCTSAPCPPCRPPCFSLHGLFILLFLALRYK